jgi:two-component system sensor histidine kinase BaeS
MQPVVTRRLIWKLLATNIPIIAFVIVIVWLAVDYLAAQYFVTLMHRYHISPTSSHEMFVGAVHRYLIWASVTALMLAVGLSFLVMRKVLSPLMEMTEIIRKIASGDYSGRVPVRSRDEIGLLALAFNQMAANLERIEQLRKTMIIDVAHELRTPLTNITGYLEALSDDVVSPSRETFQLLQEESGRLAELVEDILRLARADAAQMDLRKEEVHLGDLIAQVLAPFRSRFEAKGIRVEVNVAEAGRTVRADPRHLSQVIQNLLENAWQYTQPEGEVRIRVEGLPDAVKVLLANSRGELEEKDLSFLFERFYRGEKSRSRDHGGAGIGLAIVKGLIEAHGGRVGAELAEEMTVIWFTLPL